MVQSAYVQYLQDLLKTHKIQFLSEDFFKSQKIPSDYKLESETKSAIQEHQAIQNIKLHTNMQPPLTGKLVERYSRQMLLNEINYDGQLKITNAKVALIGCGGIGCPLGLYLAGAGVGTLGLFDSDRVDITNLHRQIGHKSRSVGMKKTQSLKQTLRELNPNIIINQYQFITTKNCSELQKYDLVIDGSDNPKCRYIVNDYCMKIGKTLLSGACIGWQGQITCYGGTSGPCYRCIWGNQQKTTGGCSTVGVVGMLPGFVGIILAIQAIKCILQGNSNLEGNLLTYESKSTKFRMIKLRSRQKDCIGCGQNKLQMNSYNYSIHAVCKPNTQNLPKVEQITWKQFLKLNKQIKILDVRPSNQFKVCHFENMVNIPYQKLCKLTKDELATELQALCLRNARNTGAKIYICCNRGINSRRACQILEQSGVKSASIQGGMTDYSTKIDDEIPLL